MVLTVAECRLADEDVGTGGEVDQRRGRRSIAGIRHRAAVVVETHRVGRYRMHDAGGPDRERADVEAAIRVRPKVERLGHSRLWGQAIRRRHSLGRTGWPPDRDRPTTGARPVPPGHVETAQVETVIRMQMAEQYGVDVGDLGVALQYAECAVAEVEQEPSAVGLDQICRRGRVGARQRSRAAENGQSHRRTSTTAATSGPRKRRPNSANGRGSPVARNSCPGAGRSSSRIRPCCASTR